MSSYEGHKGLNIVAIMGGTYSPIHNGHLRVAVEVADLFALNELKLVPCLQPVHKSMPIVSTLHRLEMLKLAIKSDNRLTIDDREIIRSKPSYSIDTLRELRSELGESVSIVMVIGMDSFLSLCSWKDWQELTLYAHVFVVSRPGWHPSFSDELNNYYEKYRASSIAELQCAPSGRIWFEALAPLDISSSMIRRLISSHRSIAYLVPDSVRNYIDENKLYLQENTTT